MKRAILLLAKHEPRISLFTSVGVILFAGAMTICSIAHAQRLRPGRHPGPGSPFESFDLQVSRLCREDVAAGSPCVPDRRLRSALYGEARAMAPDAETIGWAAGKPWLVSQSMGPGEPVVSSGVFPRCPDAPIFVPGADPVIPPPLPDGSECAFTTATLTVQIPAYTSNGVEPYIASEDQPRRWWIRVFQADVDGKPVGQMIEDFSFTLGVPPQQQLIPPALIPPQPVPPVQPPPKVPPVTTFGRRQ